MTSGDNLLIQGDNLDALKALLSFYRGRTFPDFFAELVDGRLAVIEYKGAHLRNDPGEIEMRKVGELWVASSGGRCAFRFVYLDDGGLNMEAQLDRTFKG